MHTSDISAMEYVAMSDLAKEVSSMHKEFQEMTEGLADLVSSLDGQWQGKAQVEFTVAYKKLKPKLDTIRDVLENYAKEINNAITGQQDTESFNSTLFKKPPTTPKF